MSGLPWRVLCADGELYCVGATLAEAEELLSEADRRCDCRDLHAIDALPPKQPCKGCGRRHCVREAQPNHVIMGEHPPNRRCTRCQQAGRSGLGHNIRTCWYEEDSPPPHRNAA